MAAQYVKYIQGTVVAMKVKLLNSIFRPSVLIFYMNVKFYPATLLGTPISTTIRLLVIGRII